MKLLIIILLLSICNSVASIGYCEIDNSLINAIIEIESGGDPNALSPAGAIGLMQITPIVLAEYNMANHRITRKSLCNPDVNEMIGTWYLNRLKDHYLKDDYTIERILASYNGGITRLRRLLKQGKDWQDMPKESVQYVQKVLNVMNKN